MRDGSSAKAISDGIQYVMAEFIHDHHTRRLISGDVAEYLLPLFRHIFWSYVVPRIPTISATLFLLVLRDTMSQVQPTWDVPSRYNDTGIPKASHKELRERDSG